MPSLYGSVQARTIPGEICGNLAALPGTTIKPQIHFSTDLHKHFQGSIAPKSAVSYVGIGWVEMMLEYEYIRITQMLRTQFLASQFIDFITIKSWSITIRAKRF
jgi:hypothetical protein